MEFFESAHLPLKPSPKKHKMPNQAAKKHLKQMLNAYKCGNKEILKNLAENSIQYDTDDAVSISDSSDVNNFAEANISTETISSNDTSDALASKNEQLNTIESLSEMGYDEDAEVISNDSTSDLVHEDAMESITEYDENFNSLTSSDEVTDKSIETNSSSMFKNLSGNESDSSLGSSNVSELISDDDPFDPDGVLASKIIEKLKLKQHIQLNQSSTSNEKKLKPKVSKNQEKISKDTKNEKNSKKKRESTLNDKLNSDVEGEKEDWSVLNEITDNSIQLNINLQDDDDYNSMSDFSSPFVSITATDMVSQSLSDVIGDYRNPTVKNLPSEKQNTVHDGTNEFKPELMLVDDLGEEVDSLIPELDEDLAIEDLSIESASQEPIEGSTAYDDTVLTDVITDNELSYDKTTEDDKIKVYPGKNCFIFVMKHPAELYIHGKVKIACFGGTTELFGYTLREEPVEIYAPYCYFAQCVKTIQYQNIFQSLFRKLSSAGLSVSNAEDVVTSIGENDVVLCLSKLSNKRIDFVDNNCESTDLFTKRVDTSSSCLKYAADTLGCSLYVTQQKRRFDEKESWGHVVNCGKVVQSRGVICGGKGTGKSTFLRYYVNRILDATDKPVLVIDLDPGQAEFTVPGCISANVIDKPLFGPNFTHLRESEKTLNLGMINPMDNPFRYISAVNELILYCKHIYRSMPWIVNTMGMCNQLGLKFITFIILQIQPTFLFQIDSKTPKKRYEFDLHSLTIKKLFRDFSKDRFFNEVQEPSELEYEFIMERFNEVSSEKFASGTMTPREERYLNILAYFGKLLDINNTKGLLQIVPYEVRMANFNMTLNVKIVGEALIKVINGKIVALCQETLTPGNRGKLLTLRDKALLCHGHGLIRGIDREKGLLYILTPAPVNKLNLVNTLMYVDWMPELLNQEGSLPRGSVVPYRASNSTSTGLQHRQFLVSPRRRFNPLQLLKMSRTT